MGKKRKTGGSPDPATTRLASDPGVRVERWKPDRAGLMASASFALVVSVLCWPVFKGWMIVNPMSDALTGFSFRSFALGQVVSAHSLPAWNPYIFGGMPFVGSIGGDTFYPSTLLRMLFGVGTGFSLGLMISLVLAGLGTFLFLRSIAVSSPASWVGGMAYMLSGQVFSLLSPGHDGKMFVSSLLPYVFLALFKAVVTGSWRWYMACGALMGLSILSPHFQMTYYLLMAGGAWWAWLFFASGERHKEHSFPVAFLFLCGAAVVAIGVSAVQLVPFFEYLPLTPRSAAGSSSTGWEYATSWSMPPEEAVGVFWAGFSGWFEHYWGRNPFKLHGEYSGVVVVLLSFFSLASPRRKTAFFFMGLLVFALLFAWGGHTPFYRIPYTVLPGIAKTRAVSMIFYLGAFSLAILAAFGAHALSRSTEQYRLSARRKTWLFGGIVVALAILLAAPLITTLGSARYETALTAINPARLDALRAGLFLALAGLVVSRLDGRRLPWIALLALVTLDLASVQWRFAKTMPVSEITAPDEFVKAVKSDPADPMSYRVLPMGPYVDNYLMQHGIRSVLGYHGQELHRIDELLGGKNQWSQVTSPQVLAALAVKYVVLAKEVEDPSLIPVAGPVSLGPGEGAWAYRLPSPAPFASVARVSARVTDEEALGLMRKEGFDPLTMAALTTPLIMDLAKYDSASVPQLTLRSRGVKGWDIALSGNVLPGTVVLISEPWTPFWQARAGGVRVPVMRAQYAMTAVVVPAGTTGITLEFVDSGLSRGLTVTLLSLLALCIVALTGLRRRDGGVSPPPLT